MSQKSDEKYSPNNGSKVVSNALKLAKNGVKTTKKVASTVLEGLAGETMITLACVLGFLLLINIILSVVPSGILLKKEGDAAVMEGNTKNAIEEALRATKDNSNEVVLSYLNENYGCEAKISDFISNDGNSHALVKDSCTIEVNFTPNIGQITSDVMAYTIAINGTIDYLTPEKELFVPKEHMFEVNENKDLELTSYGQEMYNENSNEFTNSSSDKLAQTIKESANTFFTFDSNSENWQLNDFYLGTKTKIEKIGEKEKKTEVPCWYGSVVVPVYYDLSSYKKEEIEQAIDYVSNNSNLNRKDAKSFVNSLINDYYNNYYELLKSNIGD